MMMTPVITPIPLPDTKTVEFEAKTMAGRSMTISVEAATDISDQEILRDVQETVKTIVKKSIEGCPGFWGILAIGTGLNIIICIMVFICLELSSNGIVSVIRKFFPEYDGDFPALFATFRFLLFVIIEIGVLGMAALVGKLRGAA